MAHAPVLKVYTIHGEYIAACKHAEHAAAIVSLEGIGATIRHGHSKKDVVWTEGKEECAAGESYDTVAETIARRIAS